MVSGLSMGFRVKSGELWSLYNYIEPLKQLVKDGGRPRVEVS